MESRYPSWSVSICPPRSTPFDHSLLIDRLQSEFGVTDTPLDWLRSYRSSSRSANISQTQFHSMSAYRRDQCSPRCCSPCTAVLSLTLSLSTASAIINTPTILNCCYHCVLTTRLRDWPFLRTVYRGRQAVVFAERAPTKSSWWV